MNVEYRILINLKSRKTDQNSNLESTVIDSGATTTTAATGFGTLGATTSTATGFGTLGTATSGASIFGTPVAKSTASGLGGVDPKTTTTAAGTTTDGAKTR